MSGQNLVVVKGKNIAFSEWLLKENKMPTRIGLPNLLVLAPTPTLLLPLSNGALTFLGLDTNGMDQDKFKDPGPYLLSLTSGGDLKTLDITSGGGMDVGSFRVREETFFVRSGKWHLESAATAAGMIYDDVGKIYEEGYLSKGITPPPYFVGKTSMIQGALGFVPTLIYLEMHCGGQPFHELEDPMAMWNVAAQFYDKHPGLLEEEIKSEKFNRTMERKVRIIVSELMRLKELNGFD